MADAAAQCHYAGETKPGTMKQTTREEPGAHPKHVEGDGRAGGTTERRVDSHSDHGGAIFDDGDASVAVVDKMVKQPSTQHHGNMAKLTACQAQAETDRGALAMAKRARQRCCRPQGRKAASGGSRRNQATRAGWLGAQGVGETIRCFAAIAHALVRWRGLNRAVAAASGKQRTRAAKNGDGAGLIA